MLQVISIHAGILNTENNTRQRKQMNGGRGEECTKWICKGKKNELEERFTKEFVKKEEKYIAYEDQLKTTEVSLLYSTTLFFFSGVWNIFREEDA